jgi:hypothetical protein
VVSTSFPHCTNKHVEKQFCGSSLCCTVVLSGALALIPREQLLLVGEFRSEEDFARDLLPLPHTHTHTETQECSGMSPSSPAHTLSLTEFLSERKTIATMFGRYYEGKRCSDDDNECECVSEGVREEQGGTSKGGTCNDTTVSIKYKFNPELAGWNYGWQSNKHKTKHWHVFQISVYALDACTSTRTSTSTSKRGGGGDGVSSAATATATASATATATASSERFSLILRTSTSPFRILAARRYMCSLDP